MSLFLKANNQDMIYFLTDFIHSIIHKFPLTCHLINSFQPK